VPAASSCGGGFAHGPWICFVEVLVGTRRDAPAPRVEDPSTGRLVYPTEVGELCQKCLGQK